MRPPRLYRKVAPPNTDHALGVGEPEVVDLAVPDHAGEGVGVVSGDLGGLGQGQQLVALVSKRLLDLTRRPLERAGPGLIAEGLTEFLGFGEDLSDCLVYGAALLAQTDTPPKESCSSGGVLARGGLCALRPMEVKGPTPSRCREPESKWNPIKETSERSAACTRLYVLRLYQTRGPRTCILRARPILPATARTPCFRSMGIAQAGAR